MSFRNFVTGPGPAYLLVLTDFFGLGCIMPLLPFFTQEKAEANKAMWLGAILTGQAAGVVLGTIINGRLSDTFGRRTVGIICMCGDCVMFFLSGIVTTPESMLAVRLLAGLFCPIPCAYGWIIDISPPAIRAKRLGQTSAAIMGGMFFGFTTAAIVGEFANLFVAMLVPSVFAGCVAVLFLFFVPTPVIIQGQAHVQSQAHAQAQAHATPAQDSEVVNASEVSIVKQPVPKKANPGPVLATGRWRSLFLTQFGVGLAVGHFTAIAMLMMVKKHGVTALGLGIFNICTIFIMLLSNLIVFPRVYQYLGQDLILSGGLIICGIGFCFGWYCEFNLFVYFALMLMIFLIVMLLLPTGQMAAADLSKVLTPTAVGSVQGLTRVGLDFGKVLAPIISATIYGDGEGSPWAYIWVGVSMVLIGCIHLCCSKAPEEVRLFLEAEKETEKKKQEENVTRDEESKDKKEVS